MEDGALVLGHEVSILTDHGVAMSSEPSGVRDRIQISSVAAQLRTTDLAASIRFYTTLPGFTLAFRYEDFYAGIRAGAQVFHLKLVDTKDPSIDVVARDEHLHLYFETPDVLAAADAVRRAGVPLAKEVHVTDWGTREFVVHDDQGHTLYFGGPQ
jgi:catechol 2,3-dioxygenase-like lactoylglutathione lyase family enzyme